MDEPTAKRKQELAHVVICIRRCFEKGDEWGCYVYASEITDIWEQMWLWNQFPDKPQGSGIRAAIKRFQLAERMYAANDRDGSK